MNVLTKAFVVLVAVMSIIVMAMVVSFAANTQNYKAMADDMKSELATAQRLAANANNAVADARQARTEEINALNRMITELTGQKTSDARTIAELTRDLTKAESDLRQSKLENGTMVTALKTQTDLTEALAAEVEKRRKDDENNKKRIVELTNFNNEVTAERDALERQAKSLGEAVVKANARIAELEQELSRRPQVAEATNNGKLPPPTPPVDVYGKITGLRQSGGSTYVQVNVGTKDHVQEGMEFMVSRNGRFLGKVIVDTVDINTSAGQVTMLVNGVSIAQGDDILAGAGR